MTAPDQHPTALISYSHDSPEHEKRVLELCNRLRARGIDAFVDQFLPGAPSEGWPLWMEQQIEGRDFTLMVCTEAYRRRFMGNEAAGIGRGVVWEARILRNLLYEKSEWQARIVPVIIGSGDREFVPTVFRQHFYDLSDERSFESLLRHLLQQPGAEAGALGPLGPNGSRWSAFERPWLVPDGLRTRYFTGREHLLTVLRQQLVERRRAALSGLGGVGKTQTALEYAVRHRAEYPDGVFWVTADTSSALTSGFVETAKALGLTAAATSDEGRISRAVLDWFNGTNRWLLTLDNVEDRRDVASFLPQRGEGHVLLTSRESAFGELGIARGLEIVDFDGDESLRFLLKRTGRVEVEPEERVAASELAAELGNLPLALAQAAAYVAETDATFSDYLRAFRKRRLALLERGSGGESHDSVAVTWAANFEAVGVASPAAADLLRVSAFLAPDAIPFELLAKGAQCLGAPIAAALADPDDTLAMAELLRPLAQYSLVRSDARAHVYGVHRLVQEITREAEPAPEHEVWIERIAGALRGAFPEVLYPNWVQCDRLVAHIAAISGSMHTYDLQIRDAAEVFNRSGVYLTARGRYAEAQSLLEHAIAVYEKTDPNGTALANAILNLGNVFREQGQYAEAKSVQERALGIFESVDPASHGVGKSLNNIGIIFALQGQYAEAEPRFQRALTVIEGVLGPDHFDLVYAINNLGLIYISLKRHAEAEPLLKRALAIREHALGPDHPDVAASLDNLAELYAHQTRHAEAEALGRRALAIFERTVGEDHNFLAECVNALARSIALQGRYAEAEPLFERALDILERISPDHPELAESLNGLAAVHSHFGRYAVAQPLFERALAILERTAPDHQNAAESLSGLAVVHRQLGQYAQAEALFERALAIKELTFASDHPEVEEIRRNLATLRAALTADERSNDPSPGPNSS